MEKKLCTKCNKMKIFDDFSKRKNSKDGYRNHCKECIKKYSKQYREDNKKYFSDHAKQYRKDNENKIKLTKKKYSQLNAVYNTYKEKLTIDEQPRLAKDGVSIDVKCRYCEKYFIPTNLQVMNRINNDGCECSLYCSNGCKRACPVYRKISWSADQEQGTSREVQPQLRQMVLKRDNYTCQECGGTTELHCHHIWPLNESPITSADVDECVTLCKECHKLKHKIPNCGYNELKCS